jgi:hypothetical protein
MTSRHNSAGRLFLLLAFACAIGVTSTASQASTNNLRSSTPDRTNAPASIFARNNHKGGGRLTVQRSPDFGTELAVHLSIDGREVANIQRDHRYDGFVSAGHHVLSVFAVPYNAFRPATSTRVTIEPGHAYVFTAVWESDRVVLRRNQF